MPNNCESGIMNHESRALGTLPKGWARVLALVSCVSENFFLSNPNSLISFPQRKFLAIADNDQFDIILETWYIIKKSFAFEKP